VRPIDIIGVVIHDIGQGSSPQAIREPLKRLRQP
jgi:hypothetical protein